MKLHRHISSLFSALLLVSLLTSCGVSEPSVSNDSGNQAKSIQYLGSEHPLGSGNSYGYYCLDTLDNGAYLLRYIDYSSLRDIALCSQPNCAHNDEKCPAWFVYSGISANVYATDEQVLICFNGSPWDSSAFAQYKEAALPRILTLTLDGSDRKETARFNATDAFSSMPAFDGQTLYIIVTSYDEGDGTGTKAIVAVDMATGNVKTDDSVQRNELRIVGAAGRELVLEYLTTDAQTAYIAYNVDDSQLRELYNGSQPVSAVCQDGALFLLETSTGTIRCIEIETGKENTLSTDLFRENSMEWVQLASVTDEGYVVQADENSITSNYLIDKTGKTTKQELGVDSTDPHDKQRTLNIFAQTGSSYLVSPSRSFHTVKVPGPGGITYGVDQARYNFALISPEDFWVSSPNYELISRID